MAPPCKRQTRPSNKPESPRRICGFPSGPRRRQAGSSAGGGAGRRVGAWGGAGPPAGPEKPQRRPIEAERKGLPAHHPHPFPAITCRVAGGGGRRQRKGGSGSGRGRQVGESAGRCGVTMTTGPEAAREVTGTRLARGHVSCGGGGGAALGPAPRPGGPRAAPAAPVHLPDPKPLHPSCRPRAGREQREPDAGHAPSSASGVQGHRESRKSGE